MRRRRQSIVTVLLLVPWLAAGPLAMVLGGCADMGDACEAPCAVSPGLVAPVDGIARFDTSNPAYMGPSNRAPLRPSAALDPPPESVRPS